MLFGHRAEPAPSQGRSPNLGRSPIEKLPKNLPSKGRRGSIEGDSLMPFEGRGHRTQSNDRSRDRLLFGLPADASRKGPSDKAGQNANEDD